MSDEQEFLGPGDVDRMMGVLFALAGEVSILRDRLRRLERALDEGHVLTAESLEQPLSGELERTLEADRQLFVRCVLGPLLGRAKGGY